MPSMRHLKKRGEDKREILLVALGGNALIQKGQLGTIEQQFENLKVPIRQIARLSRRYRIIITHGNGPQVGNLLLQQESCDAVPRMPLEILVAQTQGQIGYMIESTLDSEFMQMGVHADQRFVSLISYVVVDEHDPAFRRPSKPIGPAYTEVELAERRRRFPDDFSFPFVNTPKGYRRVVVSPEPLTIVEKREIRQLIEMDFIVICCGGGGIPVIREGRRFFGVNAVIDKDLASAKLAEEVGVDFFIIATDVEGAYLYYGKPGQKLLRAITVSQAARYDSEGHFPEGSLGPKIEAAVRFMQHGGKKAIIASIHDIEKAMEGKAGTQITA